LARKFGRARAFYGTLVVLVMVGALMNFTPIDPIKALFWSAVINGVVAVPIMAMMMHLSSHRAAMGEFKLHTGLKTVGWLATAVMGAAAIGMIATMGQQG
jgi:Mn2+/Fe2+ NRAMP family transporter